MRSWSDGEGRGSVKRMKKRAAQVVETEGAEMSMGIDRGANEQLKALKEKWSGSC